jgi:hypothetical protein
MATTTNYSWTTPDDTALVKDGAAAIRTLGSSADTTVKALNPGTTSGDVDYYTSSTAKARIGIGTNGQVLTSNGSVPGWATLPAASSLTLLSTTTLSGASTTISSISGDYVNLFITFSGITNATADGDLRVKPNNADNASAIQTFSNGGTAGVYWTDVNKPIILWYESSTINRTFSDGVGILQIFDYANTSRYKTFSSIYTTNQTDSAPQPCGNIGRIDTNSAITSLVWSNSGGNFSSGTVRVYGVK